MSGVAALAATLTPSSLLLLATWPLFGCRHQHELFDRYDDGRPALRCEHCLRMRPNILAVKPQYRRTQPGGPQFRLATGIERAAVELDHPISDFELFGLESSR